MSERLPKTLPDVLTLPGLLRRNAQKFSERIAIREKERGIWKEITWKEYLANVRAFALGLLEIGVRKDDTISIISDNRPEWLYAELAAQAIGAIPLSHFPESEDLEELHYLLEFSDTQYVFAEDQEQTDKVLVLKDRLPKLKGILVKDFEELWRYNDPLLMKYEEVRAKGQRRHEQEPHLFEALILEIKPDDVAILCTTSGTTSRPKVSMLTHRNIIISVSDMEEMDPTSPDDNLMSFLPPGWLGKGSIPWDGLYLSLSSSTFRKNPPRFCRT